MPENHGSLLGSLLNMQLASRNPFSGQIFFCKVYWPTPFNMHFDFRPLFRITFARISLLTDQTPAISRGCTEGKAKTRGLGVWLSQSLTFGNLATATRILWCPSPAGPRAAVGGSPLHKMIIIYPTFAKLSRDKISLSRTRKKTFANVSNITCAAFAIKAPYKDL